MGTARRWASFPASGGKDDFCASEEACTHGRERREREGERGGVRVRVSYLGSGTQGGKAGKTAHRMTFKCNRYSTGKLSVVTGDKNTKIVILYILGFYQNW